MFCSLTLFALMACGSGPDDGGLGPDAAAHADAGPDSAVGADAEVDAGSGDGGALEDAAQDAADPGDAGPEESVDPYRAWTEIREVVRQSPDHLERRADELVEQADATALLEFVRDSIITLPPNDDAYDRSVRWGAAETLRSGAGTPREKAELLRDLYQRAGFESEVRRYNPVDPVDVGSVFLRDVPRALEVPEVDEARLARWQQLLDTFAGEQSARQLDPEGERAQELAEALLPVAEPFGAPETIELEYGSWLPAVRVTIDGEQKVANPMLPGSTLVSEGDLPTSAATSAAMPSVVVRVHARASDGSDRTLVEGEWTNDELVGRELSLRFPSDLPVKHHLTAPFDAPRTFTAALVLSGRDDPEQPVAEVVAGSSFTEYGDLVEVSQDGTYSVNGAPVGDGSRAPELEAMAAAVSVEVNAGRFPRVTAEVTVVDANGDPVIGLSAPSFLVEEDGVEMAARLRHNVPPPPRVLIVADRSGSIPEEFTGDNLVALGSELVSRVEAVTPGAEYRVGLVDRGLRFGGDWTRDLAELESQLDTPAVNDSTLWTALEQATRAAPSVIVMISDGEPSDALTEQIEAAIAAGPPVVGINVGSAEQVDAVLAVAAAATGGLVAPATSVSEAADAVAGFLSGFDPPTYTLEYTAPTDGSAERQVSIVIRDTAVGAGATYTIPEQRIAHSLQGLYVSVTSGGRTVTRTLAGVPHWQTGVLASAQQRDDVLAQFFGVASLSFEGFGPTPSRWLDEQLTARLSTQQVHDARGDLDALLEAFAQGYIERHAELRLAQAPLPNAASARSLTYPTALRIGLQNQRPQFEQGVLQTVDLLPVTQWRTVHEDPSAAWRTTLEKTLSMALAEDAGAVASALSMLEGQPLVAVDYNSLVLRLRERDLAPESVDALEEARRHWGTGYVFLIPETGEVPAMWAVHRASGAVYGVLPDGSGGSVSLCDFNERFRRTNDIVKLILSIRELTLPMSFAGGGLLSLSVAIIQIVLLESAIVSALPPTTTSPEELEHVLSQLQVALDDLALLVPLGGAGALSPTFEKLWAAKGAAEAVVGLVSPDPPNGCF